MDEAELQKIVEFAIFELFFQWRIANVTHVTIASTGFQPIDPKEAEAKGMTVYSVAEDVGPIIQSMMDRARGSVDESLSLAVAAALGGKGGRA